jgi:hypothetical protein
MSGIRESRITRRTRRRMGEYAETALHRVLARFLRVLLRMILIPAG